MSGLPNSQPNSTTTESPADLSLNLDEAMDLQLGFGALGGLRHSRACDAAERSQRRYDERNHRLHEARAKKFGVEGEESSEDDDMAQQVLIRSPVTHHHHYAEPSQPAQPSPAPVQPTVNNPAADEPAWKKWAKRGAIAAALASGPVGASVGYYLSQQQSTPPAQTEVTGPWVETEVLDHLPEMPK